MLITMIHWHILTMCINLSLAETTMLSTNRLTFAFGALSIITRGLILSTHNTNLAKSAEDVKPHEQSCNVKLNRFYIS